MIKVDLSERMKNSSLDDIEIYTRLYKIWARQKRITINLISEEDKNYAIFDNSDDALLFKLTIYLYDMKKNKS